MTKMKMLNEITAVSASSSDKFVGLRFVENSDGKTVPQVVFPHGYALPDDNNELRRDILNLFAILRKFRPRTGHHEEGENREFGNERSPEMDFPVMAYLYIIRDYLDKGYYVEKELHFKSSPKGKISWKRTIAKKRPQISENDIVYMDFIIRADRMNDDNMLAIIHKYCVYVSFELLGWLFTAFMPQKPLLKPDIRLYTTILKREIACSFNDSKKMLIKCMLQILADKKDDADTRKTSYFGTTKFYTVWEKLIDHIYGGVEDIDKFYPHASWFNMDGTEFKKSTKLRPDSIMKNGDKTYILDAKYYTYGIDRKDGTLPTSSDVQKQITYAENALEKNLGEKDKLYNAFILPHNGNKPETVAYATADWYSYSKNDIPDYFYIPAVLVDTRTVMTAYSAHDADAIQALADEITKAVGKIKNTE